MGTNPVRLKLTTELIFPIGQINHKGGVFCILDAAIEGLRAQNLDGGDDPRSQLREKIAGEIRRAIGVGVAVELKPPGEFERTQFKARRIIDLRT